LNESEVMPPISAGRIKARRRTQAEEGPGEQGEARFVKLVAFDAANRVLVIRRGNRLALPGGRIEWDDDDAGAAARREAREQANVTLGPLVPVATVWTRDGKGARVRALVFAGRVAGEAAWPPRHRRRHAFVETEALLGSLRRPGEEPRTVRKEDDAAIRFLVDLRLEDIRD
jgi:ADP-ribose pyrophosphatase YjhB (NUDIX family)